MSGDAARKSACATRFVDHLSRKHRAKVFGAIKR